MKAARPDSKVPSVRTRSAARPAGTRNKSRGAQGRVKPAAPTERKGTLRAATPYEGAAEVPGCAALRAPGIGLGAVGQSSFALGQVAGESDREGELAASLLDHPVAGKHAAVGPGVQAARFSASHRRNDSSYRSTEGRMT